MNYSALIENRKSVREFTDKAVSEDLLAKVKAYYENDVMRLLPQLRTQLLILGEEAKNALEGAAGYNQFLVGAPNYLVLLSQGNTWMDVNAGYIMEDLVLKLADLGLDSCWVTFTDSDRVKKAVGIDSPLEVAAIVAFGYGVKTTKRLRLNILSMSNVDISAKRRYFEPKRSLYDMVFMNAWGDTYKLDDYIGFFDDMLWEAFHAASLAPSYLNRQAYGFVIHDSQISLVRRPDSYTTGKDGDLSLGIVMQHFAAAASGWAGKINWQLGSEAGDLALPEDHAVVASCIV